MRNIVVIASNIRSTHNVGSLLRTCDGLGVSKVYLTGYTPYPVIKDDPRLPYIASKLDRQISKTALGAEKSINIAANIDFYGVVNKLKADGYFIVALEQAKKAKDINSYKLPDKVAFILGNEVDGLSKEELRASDEILKIPMLGQKESFNVVQAAAMALYQAKYFL